MTFTTFIVRCFLVVGIQQFGNLHVSAFYFTDCLLTLVSIYMYVNVVIYLHSVIQCLLA